MINVVKSIEIELSSICNAACPQCAREYRLDDKSWFPQTYLKLSALKNISDDIWNTVEKIDFAGTFGDPVTAPNLINVCEFIKSKNKNIQIAISTNGGLKTPVFWKKLANVLTSIDSVVFSIDGLEDTLDIYRVNVQYQKVLENAKVFIENGGNAVWQFVAFKHNQHQIETAKNLAKKYKFSSFKVVPTQRDTIDSILGVYRISKNIAILPPTIPLIDDVKYTPKTQPANVSLDMLMARSDSTPIDCRSKKEQSIYIDSSGNVVPCCFIGASLYTRPAIFKIEDGWFEIYNKYRLFANLYKTPLNEIISSNYFLEIENSWSKTYKTGRIAYCGITCSKYKDRVLDHKIRNGTQEFFKKDNDV